MKTYKQLISEKIKPYVSSVDGTFEVLAASGKVAKSFSKKEYGSKAGDMAVAYLKNNYNSLLNESEVPLVTLNRAIA